MMTKQQRKALLFIEAEVERSGEAPSVAEIAAHFRYRSRTQAIEVLHPVSRFEAFKFDPKTKSLRSSQRKPH
jgi:SOS-response transcriptional repressor LexA